MQLGKNKQLLGCERIGGEGVVTAVVLHRTAIILNERWESINVEGKRW